MVHSMTGYGRGEARTDAISVTVEMRSVNHRFSEVAVRMPREIAALEDAVRRTVLTRVKRGRIDVFITLAAEETPSSLQINWELARQYKEAAEQMATRLGTAGELTTKDLLLLPNVAHVGDERPDVDVYRDTVLLAVQAAADELADMRRREGDVLRSDVLARMAVMEDITAELAAFVPVVAETYRERILARIEEYIQGRCEIDESRLLHEVALFAEKADITEELTRLASHFAQFRRIADEADAIGRKLDFLVQECHREMNTIGAKANHLEISQKVVILKAELEKVKEQVQNIE